jgi:hypothetical protein
MVIDVIDANATMMGKNVKHVITNVGRIARCIISLAVSLSIFVEVLL